MSDTTKIEWADSTFNPWIGCTKVGPGCDHCYAEVSTPSRTLGVVWGPKAERHRTSPGNWVLPMRWEREHDAFFAQHGRRRRVFCASLADVFDNQVPHEWRVDLWELIERTPHLDWLLVTKRVGNALALLPSHRGEAWSNLWLGITVVNQEEADRDVPKLLAVPARVRFLSVEPLLGPVSLRWLSAWPERADGRTAEHPSGNTGHLDGLRRLDWVIVGGESGPNARPMHPDWARGLRDQCAAAGVPFLFKQWGEWIGADQDECPTGPPAGRWMWGDGAPFTYGEPSGALPLLCRAGKKAAGRLLDGKEHNGFPEVAP